MIITCCKYLNNIRLTFILAFLCKGRISSIPINRLSFLITLTFFPFSGNKQGIKKLLFAQKSFYCHRENFIWHINQLWHDLSFQMIYLLYVACCCLLLLSIMIRYLKWQYNANPFRLTCKLWKVFYKNVSNSSDYLHGK